MPSCDGSNCGACNCDACRTEYIHLDEKEKRSYEKKIKDLKTEISYQTKINKQLLEKIESLEAKINDYFEDRDDR